MQFLRRALLLFSAILPGFAFGRATLMQAQEAATVASAAVSLPDAPSQQAKPAATQSPSQQDRAETQLNQEEHQRILGVVPNFNTTDNQNAAPLSARQKFRLAFRSAVDPFTFVAVAADAGISQAKNDFPGYGQGAAAYGKRFDASYADSFDGTLWANAIFPALLHQDPRYFRKGRGSFTARLLYAVSTTVRARNDNGTWGPNYANVAGSIVAGGISNLYYPASDRGVGLTFQRAFTVTAEGALGAIGVEFRPDGGRKCLQEVEVRDMVVRFGEGSEDVVADTVDQRQLLVDFQLSCTKPFGS
jgi:hypothetical protein